MRDGRLGQDGELSQFLGRRLSDALTAVNDTAPEELRFDCDGAVARIIERFRVEPITLDFDCLTRTEPSEATYTRTEFDHVRTYPAQRMSVIVPTAGDQQLLCYRATQSYVGGGPEAFLRGDAVVFYVEAPRLTVEIVNRAIADSRERLKKIATWANQDLRGWETQLRNRVVQAASARKERLDDAAALSASLDIPLAQTDSTRAVHVPVARKTIRVQPGRLSEQTDEPRMADAIYEDVVRTLSALARAMERLPDTASRFSEEELRDLLLFVLNSNYEGAARGEVFNGNGKTDILLAWHDRNAFIGECKIWRGAKQFTAAIDQLLGYVVWRDTKAALLLFIKTGRPSEILDKADQMIRAHPSFRSGTGTPEPELRHDYLMTAKDDPGRFIRLALLPIVVRAASRAS